MDKSEDRLQIIDVLEEFESLKKNFLGINKSRIQCRNIIINSVEKILEVTCDAYSQGYENN
ncbi:MAG: hypothetical protein LBD88_02465 [Candidatus Peribacteria bacterium]|nr:hypothetical protein [Candidatus Peribacteria bacterium]